MLTFSNMHRLVLLQQCQTLLQWVKLTERNALYMEIRFSMVICLVIQRKPLIWWETRRQIDEIWSSNDRRSSILTPSSFTQETGLSILSDKQNVTSEIEPFGLRIIDWNLEMFVCLWLSSNQSRAILGTSSGFVLRISISEWKRLGCFHLHNCTRDKHNLTKNWTWGTPFVIWTQLLRM